MICINFELRLFLKRKKVKAVLSIFINPLPMILIYLNEWIIWKQISFLKYLKITNKNIIKVNNIPRKDLKMNATLHHVNLAILLVSFILKVGDPWSCKIVLL